MTYGDKKGQGAGKVPVSHEKCYEENGFSDVSFAIGFSYLVVNKFINMQLTENF